MSHPFQPRETRVPLAQRLTAHVAVTTARLLATRSPKRIRQILTTLQRGSTPATYEQALRARTTITAVSSRCSGKYCLERSLAATLLCRSNGAWPRWCAGVRATAPFASHAWIEADGIPVEEPSSIANYHAIVAV